MCKEGVVYWVPFKDIRIPLTLELYGPDGDSPTFNMFVNGKFVGRHWCINCPQGSPYWLQYYPTCAHHIGSSEHKKIVRAVNAMEHRASRKRGDELREFFIKYYGVDFTDE